jgi:deoxyribodipyrimidine photolyase-related protein
MDIFLLFPTHLFSNIDNLKNKKVYLIEEPRFFTDFKFHKLKLAYHRATMKKYYDFLVSKKINCTYIEFSKTPQFYKELKTENIYIYNPSDHNLTKKIIKLFPKIKIEESYNFLVTEKLITENKNLFYSEKTKKYNHQNFYKWQRIRLNILVDSNQKPIGGKWSFDEENRKKIPKDEKIPSHSTSNLKNDPYVKEAIEYVMHYFPKNYGSMDNFVYPIDHETSKKALVYFLKNKFELFGIYEDAETDRDPFLFHSVLSPMMNIGLLTDNEVLEETHKYLNKVPINSYEGFIRQVIGWRNYIYTIYLFEGNKMRKQNFLNHNNKLNEKIMWTGKTDLEPIDTIIRKIVDYSYAHHIERLMYLGNYLLLCQINPTDVYKIFMEWTIDAYDWVMVPNIYGMTQFADEGTMMSRPYFSSSNYILKMSDHKKGPWCDTFDALYYNFINTHEDYLSKNYAASRQVAFWRKKTPEEKKKLLEQAKEYLKKIN